MSNYRVRACAARKLSTHLALPGRRARLRVAAGRRHRVRGRARNHRQPRHFRHGIPSRPSISIRGKNVPTNKFSFLVRVTFQSQDATLTEAQVNDFWTRIVAATGTKAGSHVPRLLSSAILRVESRLQSMRRWHSERPPQTLPLPPSKNSEESAVSSKDCFRAPYAQILQANKDATAGAVRRRKRQFQDMIETPRKDFMRGLFIVTSSAIDVKRVFNFNAGPSALPPSRARARPRGAARLARQRHVRDGNEPSLAGIRKRSTPPLKPACARHLAIPDDYAVIFLQGGGSLQFAMAPMNLCLPGKAVDVIAHRRVDRQGPRRIEKRLPASHGRRAPKPEKFTRVPKTRGSFSSRPTRRTSTCAPTTPSKARSGPRIPDTGAVPLVADMSSDIASRGTDVSKRFGLIFAGAQKNLGPAGRYRSDRAPRPGRARRQKLPTLLQYRTHIKEKSLYQHPAHLRRLHRRSRHGLGRSGRAALPAIEKRNDAQGQAAL